MDRFSPAAIEALIEVVTGGPGLTPRPRFGLYRSGTELDGFFGALNIHCRIGIGSRVPRVRELLIDINSGPNARTELTPVFEAAVHPHEFRRRRCENEIAGAVDYLNSALLGDGYQLCAAEGVYRLMRAGAEVMEEGLAEAADALDLQHVKRVLAKIRKSIDADSEGAITAACSLVESVCKTILGRMKVDLPNKMDIASLAKAVRTTLNFAPAGSELPAEADQSLNTMISGLSNAANGLGAFRSQVGDAHGRGDGHPAMDGRLARFAVNLASTISQLFIETWQEQAPRRTTTPWRR